MRSFPDDYPEEELSLKLTDAANLAEPAVRQLSKQLHQAAAQYAAEGEVCCFQLVTAAQEFLQQHNRPPEEEEAGHAAPQSLWHEMQQVRRGRRGRQHWDEGPGIEACMPGWPATGRGTVQLRRTALRACCACLHVPDAVPTLCHVGSPRITRVQRNLLAAAESHEQSFRGPMMGNTFFDTLDGGGLFSDAADLPVPAASGAVPPAMAAVPVVEVRSNKATRPPKPPKPPAGLPGSAAAGGAAPADDPSQAGAAAAAEPSHRASPAAAAATAASPFAADGASLSAPGTSAAPAAGAPPLQQGSMGSAPSSGAGQELASGASVGGGGSIMRTLGVSIRGMLPRALRRYLDGGGCSGWAASTECRLTCCALKAGVPASARSGSCSATPL